MEFLEIGKIYSFNVIRSDERVSIVEYDGKEFTYPKYLFTGDIVKLKIRDIYPNGKIDFYSNINITGQSEIICQFIKKGELTASTYGEFYVKYNAHKLKIRCAKWMMLEEFKFQDKIKFKVFTYSIGQERLKPLFYRLDHPKYVYLEEYEFKIIDFNTENKLITIKDINDGFEYKAATTPSKRINIGSTDKFKFVGLDDNYNAKFINATKSFINPKIFLKDAEIELLKGNHFAKEELRQVIISQLNNKDNFWIITASRYLVEVIDNFIDRLKISEAEEIILLAKKLIGYVNGNSFFRELPDSMLSVERSFKKNSSKIEKSLKIINFINEGGINGLFNQKEKVDDELNLIQNIFKHYKTQIISENELLDLIIRVTNELDSETVNKITQRISQIYSPIISNILHITNSTYFLNKIEKQKFIEKHNLVTHSKILHIIIKNLRDHYSINKCNLFLNELDYFLEINSLNFKKAILNIIESIEPIYNIEESDNNNIVIKEKLSLDENFGVFTNGKELYVLYLKKDPILKAVIENKNNNKFEIISEFENLKFIIPLIRPDEIKSILDPNISLEVQESEIDQEEIKVIVKKVETNKGYLFGTYAYDLEKKISLDGIVNPHYRSMFIPHAFKEGQAIDVKLKKAIENNGQIRYTFQQVFDNRFSFNTFNENLIGKLVELNNLTENDNCPECNSSNCSLTDRDTVFSCDNCLTTIFNGAHFYLEEINKYIYATKNSIHGEWDTNDIFNNLRIGHEYEFRAIRENHTDFKIKSKKGIINLEKTITTINSFKYHNSSNKSLSKIRIIKYLFSIVENKIYKTKQPETKEKLLNLAINLSWISKTPKSYLINFLSTFEIITDNFRKNIDFKDSIKSLKEKLSNEYFETVEIYPQLKKISETLDILELDNNYDFKLLTNKLELTDGYNREILKLLTIKNLLTEGGNTSKLEKNIIDKIVILIETGKRESLVNISDPIDRNEIIDEDIIVLERIAKKEITEDKYYEFKETIKTPVLNNNQLNIINNLNQKLAENPTEAFKIQKQIEQIQGSINIKDKSAHKKVRYSTFKNICAMLNSNSGKIIIGVRDDHTLIGLEGDYKLMNGYDEFQQYFDACWNEIFCEPEKYRSYVNLKLVRHDNKEFCFIEVECPHELSEACFIYNDDKEESCYVKQNSTTKKLSPREINSYKRPKNKNKKEPVCVYIMKNETQHKIGSARDPHERKGTLSPKEKNLVLLDHYYFPSREIAKKVESSIQKKYEFVNDYGEWFNLENKHYEEIKKILKTQHEFFK